MPAPGDAVHGVVYKLSQPDLAALDALEDLDEGIYIRETHLVLGEDREWHQAELYRVATPEGPFEPSSRYVGWMLDGAHEHGLPAEYISKIEDLAR